MSTYKVIEESKKVECWGLFEMTLAGPDKKNPFLDVDFGAVFEKDDRIIKISGFYDGNRIYRIRFMPDSEGDWTLTTYSNCKELSGYSTSFFCSSPGKDNHGPVGVTGIYHFSYRDGTPYYPFGSTSYGWAHQTDAAAQVTLASLKSGGFNKFRTGVIPHHSKYSESTISCFPFEGQPPADWDFTRFDPAYFRMIERRIEGMLKLGIEADLILFHPYSGPWKMGSMAHHVDIAYLRYAVSRFAAYRNVWWSLANEYDFILEKSLDDWHELCAVVAEADPYHHLLSVHNGTRLYEAWKPWITHGCIQDGLAVKIPGRAVALRNAYHKPIIYDEVCYEGNFSARWGDLSAEEMVFRFWQGIISGTYVGHGEVITRIDQDEEMVWTGIGGILRGHSAPRIRFLKRIMEEFHGAGWEPLDKWWHIQMAQKAGKYCLLYFGKDTPSQWKFRLPKKDLFLAEGASYRVELIDTWEMTISSFERIFLITDNDPYFYGAKDDSPLILPERPYLALRLVPVE